MRTDKCYTGVQNSVTQETWHPVFVHPCSRRHQLHSHCCDYNILNVKHLSIPKTFKIPVPRLNLSLFWDEHRHTVGTKNIMDAIFWLQHNYVQATVTDKHMFTTSIQVLQI